MPVTVNINGLSCVHQGSLGLATATLPDAEANVPDRIAALGVRAIPTTAIVVQTLAKDWLVEIEVVAAA